MMWQFDRIGPAGLAAAVYAASEGLSRSCGRWPVVGGQAGAQTSIENYLGFPTGIRAGVDRPGARSGPEVRRRGGHPPRGDAPRMRRWRPCGRRYGGVTLSEQGTVRARAVVVASGARYERPAIAEPRSRSRATASITGRRRSRRSSASARRSPWSAPATRPAKRSCSSHHRSSA